MEYAKSNKATWKHDLFRSETLKEHFGGLRFRDITPRSVEKFILGRARQRQPSQIKAQSCKCSQGVQSSLIDLQQWQCGKKLQDLMLISLLPSVPSRIHREAF